MRAQTATLAAAARSTDRAPIALARFSDEPCERPRFNFAEVYTGANGDEAHSACVAGDGSIVRARLQASDHYLYRQRITDPTVASQWSTWARTTEYATVLSEDVFVDVWADVGTARVFACWTGGGLGNGAYWAYSTDYGGTWSASQLVKDYGAGVYVGGISGVSDGGTSWLFVAVNPLDNLDNSYVELFVGAGTAKPTTSTTSPATLCEIRGLGVGREVSEKITLWLADKDLAPLEWGAAQGPPCLVSCSWSNGVGFSSYTVMKAAGVGGPLTYLYPSLSVVQVEGGVYRFVGTFSEVSTAPAYSRGVVVFTPMGEWLTEEVPWRYSSAHGLEVLQRSGYWYIVQSDRAYKSPLFDSSATGTRLDLTEDRIRSAVLREGANEPGGALLELDNSDSYLDSAGAPGACLCLRPGSQLGLALGYRTSAGRELVFRQPMWVSRVEHGRDGRRRIVVVEARDAFGELSALRPRRTLQMANVAVESVMERAWWRVTAENPGALMSGPLAAMLGFYMVSPTERWSSVLARAAKAGGALARFYNGAALGVGWSACRVEVLSYGVGDSVWTIGAAGSPFNQARWWKSAQAFQSVSVEGLGYLGESKDWTSIWSDWRDVVEVVSDRRLDSQLDVDDRATGEERFILGSELGGVVRIGLVPGLEVGDVVTATDELAGLAAAARHVRALVTRLDFGKGEASQELTLEAVAE